MSTKQTILAVLIAMPVLAASPRFDMKVRNDFFAGFSGNGEALARGMTVAEATIAANEPEAPEAMAWHGGALMYLSGQKFQQGDSNSGMQLWAQGLDEMNKAGDLAPRSVAVLVPRAATWLAISRFVPPAQGRPLIEKGVADYEKVYEIQSAVFDKLGDHPRGELLFGIADGYARLENKEKAAQWFGKLASLGAVSGHFDQAKLYLQAGKYEVKGTGCVGCHVPAKTAGNQ